MTDNNTDTSDESKETTEAVAAEIVEETAAPAETPVVEATPVETPVVEATPIETPLVEATPVETAEAEAAEMKSRWLRSVADMENYRKRIGREKQDIIRSAAASVVESLLPVLDNMKLGLQAAENHPEAKDVTFGFKMVDDQLKRALSEQGLEELIPDGETFDPNFHECISHQSSSEVEEDIVIQTVRAGYRLNDRLIRAASVIVSSGPEKA
jgi:molecular chaperone GrpE